MSSTVCLIAKDEERGILEWLAYQRVIGFDRVTVYDNDSVDNTSAIVMRALTNDPAISYTHWPNEPGRRPQPTAYQDAIAKCETDWIGFLDTDEFLLPRRFDNVNSYLATMTANVSAVMLNWLVFGSSGLTKPDDRLVIENFTRCAMPKHGKNLFTKTIVRPQHVERMIVHSAILKLGAGIYASSSGAPVELVGEAKTALADFDGAQINHYLLKTRQDYERKVARGHASRALDDKAKQHIQDKEAFWQAHDLNDRAETRVIERYRDRVITKMKQLSA